MNDMCIAVKEISHKYPDLSFKNVGFDDCEFILELKELCLKWYIEIIYGWNTDIQREKTKHELEKHKDDMRIIMINNKNVGVTTFYEEDGEYVVGLIMVHPDCQGLGIGTKIINEYISIAKKTKKIINIKTYKLNPAKKLYERLGFKIYKEDDTHVYLKIEFKQIGSDINGK